MKALLKLTAAIFLAASCSCAFHHMQTPKTLPPGKIEAGFAGMAALDPDIQPYPGAWVRIGVLPRMDIGIHTMSYGAKIDVKYGFSEYVAIGIGGGYGTSILAGGPGSIYTFESSIYGGYPTRLVTPYCVIRAAGLGTQGGVTGEGPSEDELFPLITSVAGIKVHPIRFVSLYAELGGTFLFDEDVEPQLTGGIGLSLGY